MAEREFIRDLAVRFGIVADTKALKAFDKAIDDAKKHLEAAAGHAGDAGTAIKALGTQFAVAGAAIVGAIGGLAALSDSTAQYAVDLSQQAAALGITTDAYQELTGAMGQMDVDADQAGKALLQINDAAQKAVAGSKESAAGFELIGVKVQDLKGKDAMGVFESIADGMASTADPTKRLSAATALFGDRLATKVLPFLLQGSDGVAAMRQQVRELGGVMGTDAIAAANKYDDAMDALGIQVKGIAHEIGIAFLPALQQLADSMGEWFTRNRAIISQRIDQVVGTLARAMALATRIGGVFVRHLGTLEIALAGVATAAGAVFTALALFRAGSAAYSGIMAIISLAPAIASLGTALTALSGGAGILGTIGAALGGITALPILFVLGAIASLLANMAVVAGVVVGVLGLTYIAFDDIFTFLSGTGNSVLGDLVAQFDDSDTALGAWARSWEDLRAIVSDGLSILDSLATLLGQTLAPAIAGVTPYIDAMKTAMMDFFSWLGSGIVEVAFSPFYALEATLDGIMESLHGFSGSLAGAAAGGGGLGSLVPGFGPSSAGAPTGAGGATNITSTSSVGAVNVTTGSGDPAAIGASVSSALVGHTRARNRQTIASSIGGPR